MGKSVQDRGNSKYRGPESTWHLAREGKCAKCASGVKRGTGQPHRIETPDGFKKGQYENVKVTGTRETNLA